MAENQLALTALVSRPPPTGIHRLASACWLALADLPLVAKVGSMGLTDALPMVAVALSMGSVYTCFVGVLMPVLGLAWNSASCVVFHGCSVLSVISFHQGVVTDPGRVPDSWRSQPTVASHAVQERKSGNRGLRFCRKERVYKPDRAHYCSRLGRNVLRMDHYCPWLCTCIGYRNQKYFVLFLFHTVVDLATADVHLLHALLHLKCFTAMQVVMIANSAFISGLLSASLAPFCLFHLWLISRNMTTLEFCEKNAAQKGYGSPYDLGLYRNIQSVMGDNPFTWLLPCSPPSGSGLQWEAAASCGRTRNRSFVQSVHGAMCEITSDLISWALRIP